MYLKSIEVHGFKSFANKILFEFHDGITCIVGPNGSGKSNVADAVRWVLGEQSAKQLRGSNMQDVIFSGTESRNPLHYAYVAISLDNGDRHLNLDYNEVTIARRVYRSGESEYLMNGVVCRLKDVQELLYDTGIGKEGYSMIGQGQIEKILSGKPEERRTLFDEAAGIVTYKRRKLAARKILERERQNLLRIQDVLSELEKQLPPLERQSEAARSYLKKKEGLRNCETQLFLLEVQRMQKQTEEIEAKAKIAARDFKFFQMHDEEIKRKYEATGQKIEKLEDAIQLVRDELTQIGMHREKQEGLIRVREEQLLNARKSREDYKNRQEDVRKEINERVREKARFEEELLEHELACKRQLDEIRTGLNALVSEEENVEKKRREFMEEAAGLNMQMEAEAKSHHLERGHLETLLNLAERYDGYGNSIRRVMEKRGEEAGVLGVVADLIQVEKEYETAIETALGGSIQHIVTDDEETAKGMIAYLKKNRFGRATFLPLTSVGRKPFSVNEHVLREPGVIGTGSKLVQTEEAYKGLVEHLLGRTYVVDHVDTGIALAKKHRHSLRVVTLEGEAFQPGGSISGGAFRNNANLLGRRREISILEQRVTDSRSSLAKKRQQIEAIQAMIEGLDDAFIRIQVALQEKASKVQLEESRLAQKQEFAHENIARIQGEIKKRSEELEALVQDAKGSDEEIKTREKEIKALQKRNECSEGECDDLEQRLARHREEKEALSVEYRGFFHEREEISKQRNHLDKELLRLNNQKERLNAILENRKAYMWEEYELTYHNAPPREASGEPGTPEVLGEASLKHLSQEIKDDIRRLGDVNVNAIEDYKALLERYTFMSTQHEDLVKAEQSLLAIIKELDVGMRKRFLEEFAEIQHEFNEAFRQLFGGGKGSLELVETEDVLESGIRIVAQPPGKKLQNMMQLSGGEKALTAISLLFAIQNRKPSPFCLLDEIEATLDDSNIGRFARYLQRLAKNTQFIVITHRKGTMAAADRLYGITMQEKGISALVSVNLIEKMTEQGGS